MCANGAAILPLALGNFLGPLLLGKLFDSLGRNAHFEVSTVDRKDYEATLRLDAELEALVRDATYSPLAALYAKTLRAAVSDQWVHF